ncbi:DUF1045 domain-containing protein [Falsirhodobacter deserti]|uniref:DUF1045 domain-containing protein n=1 Tax=Falsirhodobacter deserti TaxID=1365611 RepID=UPI0030C814C6
MNRYAIYYLPPPGPLARFGAEWLGWDPVEGKRVSHPLSVDALVTEPRRYGLHGTLKAPFRLIGPQADLEVAVEDLSRRLSPVWAGPLRISRIGRFLALVPQGDQTALNNLAARIVTFLDPFRAPLTEAEIARRKPESLTPRQRELLDQWGYPFVMEEFRFHITLTGPCDVAPEALEPRLAPLLPDDFGIHEICLMGEDDLGRFHLLRRFPI